MNSNQTPAQNTEPIKDVRQSTSRQLVAIIFVLGLATKMFMLPVFLIRTSGRDAYIALAVFCAIDLISLVFGIIALKLSPDTDFFALLQNTLGKPFAKLVSLIIGLFMFAKLTIATTETVTYYADNATSDFKMPFMIIIFMVFLVAVSAHTLRSICRLNEFVAPVIIVCIVVLATIVLATGFDFANILPVMRDPALFKKALFSHSVWLGDFTPIILFVGRTKLKKYTGVCVGAAGFFSCIVSVFIAITMCAAFGNGPQLVDAGTNLSSILQFALGNAYGRIDMMSSVLWSVGAFIEVAVFFYCASRCFAYVIGRNEHFWIGVVLAVTLYVLQVFVFGDTTMFALTVSCVPFSAVMAALSLFIPLLALVCAAVNKRKTGAKALGGTESETEEQRGENKENSAASETPCALSESKERLGAPEQSNGGAQ